MSRETKPLDNIIISYYNYRRRGNKYVFIKLGREKTLSTDTLVKGLTTAVTAFKEG